MRERTNWVTKNLIVVFFCVLSYIALSGQKIANTPIKQGVKGIVIAPQNIQPPTIKKLGSPIISKTGSPEVISLITAKQALKSSLPQKLVAAKKITIHTNEIIKPFIVPLVEKPKLADILEKVPAQKPLKKNTSAESLLTYDLTNGLRDLTIGRQYQDRDNNLWTASIYSGAYKFDGKYFHYFTEAQGLSSNSVRTMTITPENEFWFGTLNGVTKYDGKYVTHFNTENGLLDNWALHVESGKANTIWIGTMKGPQMIDKTAKAIYSFPDIPELKNQVFDLKVDRQGNVWVSFLQKNYIAIIVPNRKENQYSFEVRIFQKDAIKTGLYFYEDQADNMWMAEESGLYRFNPFDKTGSALIYRNYDPENKIGRHRITRIVEDKAQNIYVATRYNGITVLEKNKQGEYTHASHLKAPNDIPNFFAGTVFQDNQKNIWIGSDGLSILKNNPFQIFNQINNPNCILEDTQKNIWIGTDNGLYRYDLKKPNVILKYDKKHGLSDDMITDLIEDELGNIWIAAYRSGITIFDTNQQQFIHYGQATGLPSNNVTKLVKDQNNQIWFSTYHGDIEVETGLSAINGDELIHLSTQQGLVERDVMELEYDKYGNFWLGSWGGGITKLTLPNTTQKPRAVHYTSQHLPIEDRTRTILSDKKGNVWTGGYGAVGITQFKTTSKSDIGGIQQYSLAQGLTSTTLESALEDQEGNLWFGTPNGLNLLPADQIEKINSQNPIIQFTEADGFPAKSCRRNVLYQSSDGTIWVGGDDHLITFDPKILLQKPPTPTIVINEVSLYNQTIDWQRDTTLLLSNNQTIEDYSYDSLSNFTQIPQGLSLAYDNNFIDFDYVGISIDDYRKVSYQTLLEGLSSNWSAPAKEAKISYNGLSPGNYTFKVRAKIAGGDWSQPLAYTFTIRPPWWFTWWAYLFYAIGVGTFLYWGYRFFSNRRLEREEARRLKELDLVKSRLYTNITHEFRTPLTVISGMTDKIQQAPNRWLQKGLPMIQRNSQQLLNLVNQLLDLSKLESGKMVINYQQGNMVSYLKYIVESIHSYASSRGIMVHFHSEETNIWMDYDEEKIQQIMVNLLSNAIKFTPKKGHVYVSVAKTTSSSTEATPILQIKIRDTGKGIPADQLPFIFDRFYQADSSTTRQDEGTGIGLALVKELVQLMEGKISVKSKIQKETEFKLELPIKQEAPMASQLNYIVERTTKSKILKQEASPAPSKNESKKIYEHTSKPSLLVIEDNLDVVAYIRSCLEKDYQVQVGNNGEEGITIALEHIPDIIITDIMMPIKDGIEVCTTLKNDERTSHIPIIMLTAKADMESKLAGLEKGADAYLSKPFYPKELLIRLDQLIENRKRLQAKYAQAQIITKPQPKTEDVFLQKIQRAILENVEQEVFGPSELAKALGTSRSQLHRKLKALTNISTSNYIQKIKLQEAKRLLSNTDKNISEIAYSLGYNSLTYFSNSFSKEFNCSPRTFRNKVLK